MACLYSTYIKMKQAIKLTIFVIIMFHCSISARQTPDLFCLVPCLVCLEQVIIYQKDTELFCCEHSTIRSFLTFFRQTYADINFSIQTFYANDLLKVKKRK